MSSFFGPGGQQDVKLTEVEQKQVARFLSDPTYFPLEFRTWLRNYIQDAGITVTTSQVRGSGVGVRTGLPAGIILPAGSPEAVPPDGKLCDGAAYQRVIEDALFAKIGTRWGIGDGSSTFNVPDLRDRSLFGAGAAIGVGQTDGHAFGTRSGWRHRHSTIDNGHAHNTLDRGETFSLSPGGTPYVLFGNASNGESRQSDTQPTNLRVGPDGTSLDGPDWAGVVYFITTGKAA